MRLFISHAHEERSLATAKKGAFDQAFASMVECFLSGEIHLGAEWLGEIKAALNGADAIVVLLSPTSQNRPWINIEAGYGVMAGKLVIPVCHSGLAPRDLPIIYSLRQGLTLTEPADVLNLFETIARATPARRLLAVDKGALVSGWIDTMSRAAAVAPPYTPLAGAPIVVWVMGSVTDADEGYRARAFKAAEALAEVFIERGYRVVVGRNLLLNHLTDGAARKADLEADGEPTDLPQLLARKSSRSGGWTPNPLVMLGSLRAKRGPVHASSLTQSAKYQTSRWLWAARPTAGQSRRRVLQQRQAFQCSR